MAVAASCTSGDGGRYRNVLSSEIPAGQQMEDSCEMYGDMDGGLYGCGGG